METIAFTQEGSRYVSDPITATADQLVVRVDFEKPGQCVIERSIDGTEEFVHAAEFTGIMSDKRKEERTVSGVKAGQVLRLAFVNGSVPSKILVLQ